MDANIKKSQLSIALFLVFVLGVVLFFSPPYSVSQTNANFNINLLLDYSVAEQSIALYEDEFINTQLLAETRGCRIAASTTGMIENKRTVTSRLQFYLDSLKYHQIIRDDIYHLESARKNAADIKALLTEMKKRNFNKRVAATVEQIFPADAEVSITIPVYVVAFGHYNVDAYVRRIIWHGDIPQFVGENEGELTIVINLAHSVDYGPNIEERLVSLLGVVAHEVFHAAFSAFKENSSSWKKFYAEHQQPLDALLDLTQNEGIAYYLSLEQQGHGFMPRDWNAKFRDVFLTFNKNAIELSSDTITQWHAAEIIRKANLSGYWDNYGSLVGMFMAREIDTRLGRASLIETIASTPYDFFRKYITLTREDSNLPKVPVRVVEKIR
jgi:hypothetical protein